MKKEDDFSGDIVIEDFDVPLEGYPGSPKITARAGL
jgi:hypothetical protein